MWLVSAAIRGMPHRHPLHRALLLYWGKMIFKPEIKPGTKVLKIESISRLEGRLLNS